MLIVIKLEVVQFAVMAYVVLQQPVARFLVQLVHVPVLSAVIVTLPI